ncbi:MAG: tetratricopeptide repeat protein [Bacteroidaceae bacterium]|nr:tetratricopeptide repeat protein [Bacteroidaceae bacterium]
MRKLLNVILIFLSITIVAACSSKKNTAVNRRIQAIKANYNTYYNGKLAYIDGRLAQEQGNKDNCTDVIPFYITGNKTTAKLGSSNFNTTIEKCQKTIKLHSITERPKWSSNKPKSEKDKIWLSLKEYNPFLHKAWFLMADAQFRKGEYLEAASTYSYIASMYFSEPDIIAKAHVLEAKCYAEMDWFYDAEDILNRASRDSFPKNLDNLKAGVDATILLRQKKYEEAIPKVLAGIKAEKRSYEKARLNFLLGQLYHRTGNETAAYKYFTKTIRMNPPYELEFNARIQRTETMTKGNWRRVVKQLKSMASNPKNKDYLDQVYYAIGNVYLSQGDTLHAIWAYNDGMEKSTRSSIEKGVLMIKLGALYYEQEEFVKAQKCYSGALGMFDKEHEDYNTINERSKILEELLPHATAVELQDSLQELAAMDSVQRMKVIEKIIEEVKKKEKEEARKAAEAAQPKPTTSQGMNTNQRNNLNNQQEAVWYFYNPTAVEAGKNTFRQKWGDRPNENHWRRKNKTVLADYNDEEESDSLDTQLSDSLLSDSIVIDSITGDTIKGRAIKEGLDSGNDSKDNKGSKDKGELSEDEQKRQEYENDPHRPEFYLKDIPFTDEQMEASNKKLVEGLYGSAVIYKDRMENFPLADRTFKRIMTYFPDFEKNEDMYYNLFQLYSRMELADSAEIYRQILINDYPDNPHVAVISDPDFIYKARFGKAVEDSIYQAAWHAYKEADYNTVIANNELTRRDYPAGDNRARFLFLSAMSRLEQGERDNFLNDMKEIVEKYPKSTVSELAGLYVKGLKEGRLLASGKFEMGSIWERRRGVIDGDSLAADTTFTDEKNCDWLFAIAYERDSVDLNRMLFEMARYNFTNFTVRNFDISIDKGDGIDMLQIRQFVNYDEAYIYLHRLMNDEDMAYKLEGLKCFIISEDNLKKLMRGLSFADYFDFYDETFDEIGHLNIDDNILDEPTELPEPSDEDDVEEYEDDGGFIF